MNIYDISQKLFDELVTEDLNAKFESQYDDNEVSYPNKLIESVKPDEFINDELPF